MFLDLSDEQLALQRELREYFSGLLSAQEREIMMAERHGLVYREVIRRMGRDSWLGVGWPTEYGGRGFG
jgi:alkylation response protein AidB-like acyl-CoA dehydrogenase